MTKKRFLILLLTVIILNIPPHYENTFSQISVTLKARQKNKDIFIQILTSLDVEKLKVEIISEEGIIKNIIYKDYFTIREYSGKRYNEFVVSSKGKDIVDTDIIKVYYNTKLIAECDISSILYSITEKAEDRVLSIQYSANDINDREEEKKLIRIATYNIHRGRDKVGYSNLNHIGEFIKSYNIDIIGLQEVDKNVSRTNFEDQLKILADKLEMYYYFGSNKRFLSGEYGNGVLSRYPLQNSENIIMQGKEPRGLLKTNVLIDENRRLNFMVTHLGLDVNERQKQFNSILEYVGLYEEDLILVGDFNVTDNDPNIIKIQQKLNDVGDKTIYRYVNTLNVFRNEYRIDYIFTSKSIKINRYKVEKVQYSDHFPVIVDIEY